MTTNLKPILRATHKDFHPHLRTVVEMGGEVSITKGNHIKVKIGKFVTHIAKTPRDPRNDIRNIKHVIRDYKLEIGLDTDEKG